LSILTKTLVVLVTILSIVLVALVVPYIATQDNQSQQITDLTTQLKTAQQSAKNLEAELAEAVRGESATIKLLSQENADLKGDLEDEKKLRQAAQADAQSAKAMLGDLKADFTVMAQAQQQDAKTIDMLSKQVETANQTVQTQGTRILQLADALDAAKAERDSSFRTVRRQQEDMTSLREDLEKAQEQLATIPPEVRKQYLESDTRVVEQTPAEEIVGQIIAVDDAGDGLILVQVNVGESDKVKKGMKFLVHEGNAFKGTLVIDRVEPRVSVGKMELVKDSPVTGDSVYAGPSS